MMPPKDVRLSATLPGANIPWGTLKSARPVSYPMQGAGHQTESVLVLKIEETPRMFTLNMALSKYAYRTLRLTSELLARTTGCWGNVASLATPWFTSCSACAREYPVIMVVRNE